MGRLSLPVLLLNVGTLGLTLVVNGLANVLPLNGRTTGAVSDSFTANLFVPAAYVFSIWGLIYVALTAFVGYQFTPGGRRSESVQRVGLWFAVTGLANSLWIVLWHYGVFPGTMALMLVLLVSLCVIVGRLGTPREASTTADRWFVYLPFSIYLGWISVATIANACIFFLDLGWDGAPLAAWTWAVLLLGVATALGAWFIARRGDLAYGAVLIWAFVGIALRQAQVPWVPQGAWFGVAVLIVLAGWRIARGAIPTLRQGRRLFA